MARVLFVAGVALLGSGVELRASNPARPGVNPTTIGREVSASAEASQSATLGLSGPMQNALIMAQSISRQLFGTRVVVAQANGNFERVFEEDAALVVEPVRRDMLRVGDMVTYERPNLRTTVVQRLTKLDEISGNEIALSRVMMVIYARKNAPGSSLATAGVKPPGASVRATASLAVAGH